MADSFEFTFHSPLTQEYWAALCDYELEHHNSVTLQTPKGEKVKYIKADILDKIRAEIAVLDDADYDYEGYYKAITDALRVIDKYKTEQG